MAKKKFKVWATWQEYSYVEVEAETKEEAIEIAQEDPDDFTPDDSPYDDGNWHIVDELTKEIK